MGWTPPTTPGRFDRLPYLMRDCADRRHLCHLPEGAVREVKIAYPLHDALSKLALDRAAPQAAPGCDVFHPRLRHFRPVPNYYRDRGGDGFSLMPWHALMPLKGQAKIK